MFKKYVFLTISLFLVFSGMLTAENYWWGNEYLMSDSKELGNYDASSVISNNNRKLAFRFTAPENITVDSVTVYVGVVVSNTSPRRSFRFKVETADAQGSPSGVLVDANAVGTYAPSAIGSKTVSFAGSFTLEKNKMYFLVIQTNGSTPVDGNNYCDFRVSVPLNDFYYYDGEYKKVDDGSFNVMSSSNNGSLWRLLNYSPLFVFRNSGSYVLGTPFNGKSTIYIRTGYVSKAQQVILSPKNLVVDMLQVYMKNSGTPGYLNFSIDEVTNINNLGIKSNVISGQFGGEPYGWEITGLSHPVTLLSNRAYMITFFCPTVDAANYYYTVGLKGWTASYTWYGINSYAATDDSDFYTTQRADLPFSLHIVDTNTSSGSGTTTTNYTTNSQVVYVTNNSGSTSTASDSGIKPSETKLYAPYPNVFDSASDNEVNLCFDVKENSEVNISIYNMRGEKVAVLLDSYMDAGRYKIKWGGAVGEFNGNAVSIDSTASIFGSTGTKIKRGIYIIVIRMNDKVIRNKFFVK